MVKSVNNNNNSNPAALLTPQVKAQSTRTSEQLTSQSLSVLRSVGAANNSFLDKKNSTGMSSLLTVEDRFATVKAKQ